MDRIEMRRIVGRCLRRYRRQIDWTQDMVAQELRVHRVSVSCLEAGKRELSFPELALLVSAGMLSIDNVTDLICDALGSERVTPPRISKKRASRK